MNFPTEHKWDPKKVASMKLNLVQYWVSEKQILSVPSCQ